MSDEDRYYSEDGPAFEEYQRQRFEEEQTVASADRESRVKPQPLQPEEEARLREEMAHPENQRRAGAGMLRRLLATIEEARREQPVRVTDAMVEAGCDALERRYGGIRQWKIVGDDPLIGVYRAIEAALAAAPEPVGVTDEAPEPIEGVKERLREVARFLYALDTENSLAARKEVLYGIQTIADQEIILKAHGKEIAYLFEKLARTGDELAALAAAPKDRTDG